MLSITFKSRISASGSYINDCCYGGDVVVGWLEKLVIPGFSSVDSGGEDWGWYKWYHQKGQRFEVNVCCHDKEVGDYEIQLYYMKKSGWFSWKESQEDISDIGEIVCVMLRDNACEDVRVTGELGRI